MNKPLLLIGVIVLVVVACRSVGVKPSPQFKEQSLEAHGRNPSAIIPKLNDLQRLDIKKFIALATGPKIIDTLKRVKAEYPDVLKYYAMLYEGRAAQLGSFTNPRIIIYGGDSRFIFTFNGLPSQVGGNVIETTSYNEKKHEFDLREIIFKNERPNVKSHGVLLDDEIEFETDQIIVSKPNPESCIECHGVTITGPIWDGYTLWPGAFGSNHDLLFDASDTDHSSHGGYKYLNDLSYPRSQGVTIDLKPGVKDVEADAYLAFWSTDHSQDRYGVLPGHNRFYYSFPPQRQHDNGGAQSNNELLDGLAELQRLNLNYVIDSLGLKSKWADIVWPCPIYCDKVARVAFDLDKVATDFEGAMGANRTNSLRQKFGPFKDFLKNALLEELSYQTHRIARMEETFGDSISPRDRTGLTEDDYTKLKGSQLNRLEKLSLQTESGDVIGAAALAYLLRDEGIFLEDYDTNRDFVLHKRILNFRNTLGYASILQYAGIKSRAQIK